MQALTKNDMKPSRAPCFFSKSSFRRSRSAMTLVMSTSLKVVSMAAVFCASFRRLAMVRRSRVMRTRSSRSARGRGPACLPGVAVGRRPGGAFWQGKIDDGTSHRGVHLDGDFVGLEFAQRLVDRNGVACLHQPLGDGRFGDRFTQRRDLDFDGHDQAPPSGQRQRTVDQVGLFLDMGARRAGGGRCRFRSEEHTSELQSRQYLVCRLLLEKKNTVTAQPDDKTYFPAYTRYVSRTIFLSSHLGASMLGTPIGLPGFVYLSVYLANGP